MSDSASIIGHWTYRVGKRRCRPGPGTEPQDYFEIVEWHVAGDGTTGYGDNLSPGGEALDALRWELEHMLAALDHPVLDLDQLDAAAPATPGVSPLYWCRRCRREQPDLRTHPCVPCPADEPAPPPQTGVVIEAARPPSVIVAEVAKNWTGDGEEVASGLLAERFERVIAVNASRGYVLHSWRLDRVADGGGINETIIAVFTRVASPPG